MYIVAFILVLILVVCYLCSKGSIKFVKSKSARAASSPPARSPPRQAAPQPLLRALLSSTLRRPPQSTLSEPAQRRPRGCKTNSTRRQAKEAKAAIRKARGYQAKETSVHGIRSRLHKARGARARAQEQRSARQKKQAKEPTNKGAQGKGGKHGSPIRAPRGLSLSLLTDIPQASDCRPSAAPPLSSRSLAAYSPAA